MLKEVTHFSHIVLILSGFECSSSVDNLNSYVESSKLEETKLIARSTFLLSVKKSLVAKYLAGPAK